MEPDLLRELEQDPAVAVHDGLWAPRRSGAVEHPERVVEGHLREGEPGIVAFSRELVPPRRVLQRAECWLVVEVAEYHRPLERGDRLLECADRVEPVVVATPVAIAVDREQHAGLDLREAVDDAPDAEVGRAARPDGPETCARMEGGDGLDHVREIGHDPVARPDSRRAERRREAGRRFAQLAPRRLVERPELRGVSHGDGCVVAATEDVLRVVEPRSREPLRSGHPAGAEHALVGRRGLDLEELPDRSPESLEVRRRPAPEIVVAARLDTARLGEPAGVAGQRRALDP